jgi:glucose/arabinose dehydrogenase
MTENGFNSYDEVNQIQIGGNNGWPIVVGKNGDPRFVDPVFETAWVTAPTGICVYRGEVLPSEYRSQIMFCEWGQGEIRVLELEDPKDPQTRVVRDRYLLGDPDIFTFKPINLWGFIDMTPGPDGAIYMSAAPGAGPGVTGAIVRLTRAQGGREPFVGIRAH